MSENKEYSNEILFLTVEEFEEKFKEECNRQRVKKLDLRFYFLELGGKGKMLINCLPPRKSYDTSYDFTEQKPLDALEDAKERAEKIINTTTSHKYGPALFSIRKRA